MNYQPLPAKTALHKLKKDRLPYSWDLNVYRGCAHRCQYCYALYSHQYLETEKNFFDTIYYKPNIAEVLDKELSKKTWKKEIVNLGGVCDSYQPIEKELGLMRQVLEVMIKHKNPIIISTKSDLIIRDLDLISQLAELTYVNVAVTITSYNESVQKKIEPGAISADRRFKILEAFQNTKASRGLHFMPILPYITDTIANIETIYQRASGLNLNYVLNGSLNLVGETKKHYLEFIKNQFPEYYQNYVEMYKHWQGRKEYREELYKKIWDLKRKYNIKSNYSRPIKERLESGGQMKMF